MKNDLTETVTIRILRHREADLLRAVPDEAIAKRRAAWDPKNPNFVDFPFMAGLRMISLFVLAQRCVNS
jgi:hypothetical protein